MEIFFEKGGILQIASPINLRISQQFYLQSSGPKGASKVSIRIERNSNTMRRPVEMKSSSSGQFGEDGIIDGLR